LKSNLNLVRKFIVLGAMLGCLLFALSFDKQPVQALQCCTVCDSMSESCGNFCDSFPEHIHCKICSQQAANCYHNCDPGC